MGIKQSLGNLLRGAEQKSVSTGDLINSTLTVNQQTTLQVFFVDGKRLDAALFEQATQLGLTPLLTDFYTQHQHIADQLTAIDTKMTELQNANQTKDATIASQQQTINDQSKAIVELAIQKGQLREKEIALDQAIPQKVQASIGIVAACEAVADTPEFQELLQLIRANKLLEAQALSQQIRQKPNWQKTVQEFKTGQTLLGEKSAALAAPFYLDGKYAEAVVRYEEAIDIYPKQPEALTNLADAYTKLPKPEYQKARLRYDQAIALYEAQDNNDKSSKLALADTYVNLGNVWQTLGEAKSSIRNLNKAFALLIDLVGNEHPSVAITYINLGNAYADLGNPQLAINWYEKGLAIILAVYGDQHTLTATTYNNLGGAYRVLGDPKQAITWYEKDLAITKALYGKQHPTVAQTYNNLGNAYGDLGYPQQAITWYDKSLAINKAVYGEQHPTVARNYNNLGNAYANLGSPHQAITWYNRSLAINKAVYGEQHRSIANNYNNLGNAYGDLGYPQQAIIWYDKSLAINKVVYGEQHPEVANTYNNLGNAYTNLGDSQNAISWYKKDLAITKALYGEQHPAVAITYNNLGFAYYTLNNYVYAKICYLKAKAIRDAMLPKGHPSCQKTDNNLRDIGINPVGITAEQLQQALNSPLPSIGASD